MVKMLAAMMLAQAGYQEAHDRAVSDSRPLVVGVGCAAPRGSWVTSSVARLAGYRAPCVVVATPGCDGSMHWVATLPAGATAAEIGERLTTQPARKKWNPYTQPNYQERMRRERSGARLSALGTGGMVGAPLRSSSC